MWRGIANQLLGMLATIIWYSSRRERVQLSAWRAIRACYPMLSALYRLGVRKRLRKDWRGSMLNRMLSVFTRIDPDFVLHMEMRGVWLLTEAHRRHGGVLVCTGHFGLTLASHKGLLDLGLDTGPPRKTNGDRSPKGRLVASRPLCGGLATKRHNGPAKASKTRARAAPLPLPRSPIRPRLIGPAKPTPRPRLRGLRAAPPRARLAGPPHG